MPFEPGTPRFHDYLARLFGARGHQAGLTILDDLMPVVDVADQAPELAYLRGERRFWLFASIGATPAVYSVCSIGLPAGLATRLLVLEQIWCWAGAAGQGNIATIAASVTPAAATRQALDGRAALATGNAVAQGQGFTAAVATSTAGAVSGMPVWVPGLMSGMANVLPAPIVLVPGQQLLLQFGTVNQALNAGFVGYEREGDEQELR